MALKRPEVTTVETASGWKSFLHKASGFLGIKTPVKATTVEARDAMMKSLTEGENDRSTREVLENRKAEGAYFTQDVDLALSQLLIDGKLKLADAADAEKMQIVLKRLAFFLEGKEPVGIPTMKWNPADWLAKAEAQNGGVDRKKLLKDAMTRIGQLDQKLAGHERRYGEKKEAKPVIDVSAKLEAAKTRIQSADAHAHESELERERFAELAASRLQGQRSLKGELARTAAARDLEAAKAKAFEQTSEKLRADLEESNAARAAAEDRAKIMAGQIGGNTKANGNLNAANARMRVELGTSKTQLEATNWHLRGAAKAASEAERALHGTRLQAVKPQPLTAKSETEAEIPAVPLVTANTVHPNEVMTTPVSVGHKTFVAAAEKNEAFTASASDTASIVEEPTKPSAEAIALEEAKVETENVRSSMKQIDKLHAELQEKNRQLEIDKEALRMTVERWEAEAAARQTAEAAALAAMELEMERMRAQITEVTQAAEKQKTETDRWQGEVKGLQEGGRRLMETLDVVEKQRIKAEGSLETAYQSLWDSIVESEKLKKAALPKEGSTIAVSASTRENIVQSFSSSSAFAEPTYATNVIDDSVVISTDAVRAEEPRPKVAEVEDEPETRQLIDLDMGEAKTAPAVAVEEQVLPAIEVQQQAPVTMPEITIDDVEEPDSRGLYPSEGDIAHSILTKFRIPISPGDLEKLRIKLAAKIVECREAVITGDCDKLVTYFGVLPEKNALNNILEKFERGEPLDRSGKGDAAIALLRNALWQKANVVAEKKRKEARALESHETDPNIVIPRGVKVILKTPNAGHENFIVDALAEGYTMENDDDEFVPLNEDEATMHSMPQKDLEYGNGAVPDFTKTKLVDVPFFEEEAQQESYVPKTVTTGEEISRMIEKMKTQDPSKVFGTAAALQVKDTRKAHSDAELLQTNNGPGSTLSPKNNAFNSLRPDLKNIVLGIYKRFEKSAPDASALDLLIDMLSAKAEEAAEQGLNVLNGFKNEPVPKKAPLLKRMFGAAKNGSAKITGPSWLADTSKIALHQLYEALDPLEAEGKLYQTSSRKQKKRREPENLLVTHH